jgi:hypothetical protein
VHVVSTNAVLVHCQLLPSSSAVGTSCGAATLRKAAKASVIVEIASARLLLFHCVPASYVNIVDAENGRLPLRMPLMR